MDTKVTRGLGATLVLAALLVASGAACANPLFAGAEESHERIGQVRALKQEISLLNLLNGLYLSQDQVDRLVSLARRAVETRETFLQEMNAAAEAYVESLRTFREALYSPYGAGDEAQRTVLASEVQTEKTPIAGLMEQLGQIEDEARTGFSDGQLAIIADFKPCLIPPKNLADPVAVGQASTTEREEAVLDIIRRMPEDLYRDRADVLADRIVALGEIEKGKLPADVRANTVATYLAKMNEVRQMPKEDFELTRHEVAESFRFFDDDVTYHRGHTRDLGPVSRHFLNPTALEVLEKWRIARLQDSPDASKPLAGAAAAPGPDRPAQVQKGLVRYGQQAQRMLHERRRMGRLNPAKAGELARKLRATRDIASIEHRFCAVSDVCDALDEVAVTPMSVQAMFMRVRGLAVLKQVPLAGPKSPRLRQIQDVTGLGHHLAQARALADKADVEGAYVVLARVAHQLEQFQAP